MIAWINFAILIFASLFFLYFYFLSVSPAALERVKGEDAYRFCGQYRRYGDAYAEYWRKTGAFFPKHGAL